MTAPPSSADHEKGDGDHRPGRRRLGHREQDDVVAVAAHVGDEEVDAAERRHDAAVGRVAELPVARPLLLRCHNEKVQRRRLAVRWNALLEARLCLKASRSHKARCLTG